VNGTNFNIPEKHDNDNTMRYMYFAGGGVAIRQVAGHSETGWNMIAHTWSDQSNADEFKVYWNAVQEGATLVPGGDWVGALSATATLIGALANTPTNPWHGWLAHAAVWDRVLSLSEIQELHTV
jgi:hypothetical protein